MAIYNDDQCVRCGGIRVKKSVLCADCLVKSVNNLRSSLYLADARIRKLEEKECKLTELVDKLLEHISSEAVYTSELRLELWKAKETIKGG